MVSQNKKIACWGAFKWTAFLAWCQIVVASVGIIGLIAKLDGVELFGVGVNIDLVQPTKDMIWVVLVLLILHFTHSILLLIGNQREKLDLMRRWVSYTLTAAGFGVIGSFMRAAAGDTSMFLRDSVSTAISAFMIYIVHLRMQDIEVSSGGRTDMV